MLKQEYINEQLISLFSKLFAPHVDFIKKYDVSLLWMLNDIMKLAWSVATTSQPIRRNTNIITLITNTYFTNYERLLWSIWDGLIDVTIMQFS